MIGSYAHTRTNTHEHTQHTQHKHTTHTYTTHTQHKHTQHTYKHNTQNTHTNTTHKTQHAHKTQHTQNTTHTRHNTHIKHTKTNIDTDYLNKCWWTSWIPTWNRNQGSHRSLHVMGRINTVSINKIKYMKSSMKKKQ